MQGRNALFLSALKVMPQCRGVVHVPAVHPGFGMTNPPDRATVMVAGQGDLAVLAYCPDLHEHIPAGQGNPLDFFKKSPEFPLIKGSAGTPNHFVNICSNICILCPTVLLDWGHVLFPGQLMGAGR